MTVNVRDDKRKGYPGFQVRVPGGILVTLPELRNIGRGAGLDG